MSILQGMINTMFLIKYLKETRTKSLKSLLQHNLMQF